VFSYSPPGILWAIVGFVLGVGALVLGTIRGRRSRPAA